MKKLLAATTLCMSLSACVALPIPFAVGIPVGLAIAPTVDRGANLASGGTPGNTISGDAGAARKAGNEAAANACQIYDVGVGLFDAVYFSGAELEYFQQQGADHCERWRLYESGELKKAIAND